MEIRAANFTQQAWKQKNFILHFAIIFSLYNSPSDMQYRLSINISVAFRAHTFTVVFVTVHVYVYMEDQSRMQIERQGAHVSAVHLRFVPAASANYSSTN